MICRDAFDWDQHFDPIHLLLILPIERILRNILEIIVFFAYKDAFFALFCSLKTYNT
jgi:hypothetical protein